MMLTNRVHALSIAALTVSLGFSTADGQTIFVDAAATGFPHDGSSWCSAFLTLQDALAGAASGEMVKVAEGTYMPDGGYQRVGGPHLPGTGDRLATFPLNSGVTLLGGYAGCGATDPDARDFTLHETILSGDLTDNDGPDFLNNDENSYHVAHYSDPNATDVVIDGFTVTAGNANGTLDDRTNQGAGIHIRNDALNCIPNGPTISNCTIRNNWGANHGAINDHALNTVIDQCVFQDNFAGERGGGLFVQSGSPTVTNTQFLRNRVGDVGSVGGGMWCGSNIDPTCIRANHPVITGCTFIENEAFAGGGFGAQRGAGPILTDVSFRGNQVISSGGGAYIDNVNASANPSLLWKCLFQSNFSESQGGGLFIYRGGQVVVVDSDFIQNEASSGAGMKVASGSVATVFNSRFIENGHAAPDEPRTLFGGGLSVTTNASVSVTNSLFAGNQAAHGGALYLHGTPNNRFTNCTIAYNRASLDGAAMYMGAGAGMDFTNSILWGNLSELYPSSGEILLLPGAFDPCFLNSAVEDGAVNSCAGSVLTEDPLFLDPAGEDGILGTIDDLYQLRNTSPYIDGGITSELPADSSDLDEDLDTDEPVPFDLAGDERVVGLAVDLGAYETNVLACPPGSFSATGEEPCNFCASGTFQPDSGETECIPCPAGAYQPDPGAVACIECDPETFQALVGQESCTACDCEDPDTGTQVECEATTGECLFAPIVPIPATSQWGLLVFTLLVCTAGTVLLRRRTYAAA